MQWLVMSLFLYFPEDKSEYIPAVISLTIFMIAAGLTMWLIIKISRKQAKKAKEYEEQLQHTMKKNS